jgi:hypothetical protein
MTRTPSTPTSVSAQRLPALKPFAQKIRASVQQKRLVSDSADWLAAQAATLNRWADLEDVAIAAYDEVPDRHAKAVCHHLMMVRAELARQLWGRHIFVGVSVLDELLFMTTKDGAADPVLATLEKLRDSRLDFQSLLIFPLQSYGVLAAGLLRPLRGDSTAFINAAQRFVLTPQTNDLSRTTKLINDLGPQLGVKKPIDHELIEHWRRSRGARWLADNPLLIAGVASVSGYYYENEFLLLGRVRAITAAIAMLATLQPRKEERTGMLFSSSQINNWETRDIRHYLLLSDTRGKRLTGRAVPIHKRRQIDSLSELAIELDPRYWGRRPQQEAEVYSAVDNLYGGYLRHSVGTNKEDALSRTHRKLFDAVDYFRRSHQGSDQDWGAVVSLATAFEMVLTDQFERGVTERLRRRVELLLRGVAGTRRYQASVVDVYGARSRIVHRGEVADLDLSTARKAFVLVFLSLMRRMSTLQPTQKQPLAFLTGDPKP